MNTIVRLWNQNRRIIIVVIAVIVFLIIILQVLNEMAKRQNEAKRENKVVLTEEEKKLPTESIIGGDSVSIDTTKDNVAIIQEFIDKCNKKDVAGAYNMLTTGCKNAMYKTEELFKTGYCDVLFAQSKLANIDQFLSRDGRYTYLVKLYIDPLTTGNATSAESYQDYITIDKDGKLNIRNLIYAKDINKKVEKNGVTITIVSQEIYKDNEKYQVKVENKTGKTIGIDTGTKAKTIYVVGDNNVVYGSNILEIASIQYKIENNASRTYTLKFNKIYSSNVKTFAMVFTDILPDYEQYKISPDTVKDRIEMGIEF